MEVLYDQRLAADQDWRRVSHYVFERTENVPVVPTKREVIIDSNCIFFGLLLCARSGDELEHLPSNLEGCVQTPRILWVCRFGQEPEVASDQARGSEGVVESRLSVLIYQGPNLNRRS